MKDTSSRSGMTSLRTTSLQSSLESKLRRRLEGRGSQMYGLKWKHWDMPLGQPICALRASVPRISDSGFSLALPGWPTSTTRDGKDGSSEGTVPLNGILGRVVRPAGWTSPTVNDSRSSDYSYQNGDKDAVCLKLPGMAKAAGWAQTSSWRSLSLEWIQGQLAAFGEDPIGCFAEMPKSARLNPEHSRWLMGYPREWASCVVTGTP